MKDKKALLLNSAFQPIKLITWKRAICMFILEKVDVLEHYDEEICSPTVSFKKPAVVRLKNTTYIKPMRIRFSRANIYNRDKRICQYCGGKFKLKELTLDHVIPKSMGGKTTWKNIVTSCVTCNGHKANRTPQQANMRLVNGKPTIPSLSQYYLEIVGSTPEEWKNWLV